MIAIPEMERVLKPGDFVVFVGFQEQLVGRMAKVVQADLQANEVEVELRLFDGKASLVIPRSTVAYATPQPDSDEVYKRYLCTHPNRRGRLTLYKDGKVSWAHLYNMILLKECRPHGSWALVDGKLFVNFHHQGLEDSVVDGKKWSHIVEHIYIECFQDSDIWHLAGVNADKDALRAAVLEPWGKTKA